MDIVFRKLQGCVLSPPDGEMHIRAHAPEHLNRRDFSTLVIAHGISVFPRGSGQVQRIVVDAEPTLDDLLAATLAARILLSEKLPDGCLAFARYAALVREGLKPSDAPLEISLEGIYLALRNSHGADLTDAAAGASFLRDWTRLAEEILRSAALGMDPFTRPLFAAGPEFARERAFLARDHEVFNHDVLRGERWTVRIPGGPPRALALILRRPKSLLFKYWSRHGHGPTGQVFLFLGVSSSTGQWIFSTDPIHRLSLKPLAEILQAAEAAQDPRRAENDPWFDGKPFGHTLIAVPRGGTIQSDGKVLGIVKHWSKARPLARPGIAVKAACFAAAAAGLLLAGLAAHHFFSDHNPGSLAEIDGKDESADPRVKVDRRGPWAGKGVDPDTGQNEGEVNKGNLYLVAVGVSTYKNRKHNLAYAGEDARDLAEALRKNSRGLYGNFQAEVLTDENATRKNLINKLALLKAKQNDLVIVTLAGHGALNKNRVFYFLPYDYDEDDLASTGVRWDDFKVHLEYLPCRVFIVVDTCHSGAVTEGLRSAGDRKAALAVSEFPRARGMVVMAACLESELAQERNDWKHGALTLALLEGISGTRLYRSKTATELPRGTLFKGSEDKVITLHRLNTYVTDRVAELADYEQAVVTNQTGNIDLNKISVAVVK